jgi:exonuclease III
VKHKFFAVLVLLAAVVFPFSTKASSDQMTVLVYNVFDPFFGPDRAERMAFLPEAIMDLSPVPDVIVLVEAFKKEDRQTILARLIDLGYPVESNHYLKKVYGTGIMLISRYPLTSWEFTPYNADGAIYDPEHYSAKGVMHYVLDTPYGPLDVFATHPIARFKPLYDKDGNHNDRDRRTVDRILEMERIARTMREQADPEAKSVILLGDLNMSPDMWSYQYLVSRTNFTDSHAELHPGEYASTYAPDNTFVAGGHDFFKIDHIFYKNFDGQKGPWLKPVKSKIEFTKTYPLENGEETHLSDHYGVMAVFDIVGEKNEAALGKDYRPENISGKRSKNDIVEDGVKLTPENHLAWQAWAVETIFKADENYNRYSKKAVLAARIVIAGDVEEDVVIPVSGISKISVKLGL